MARASSRHHDRDAPAPGDLMDIETRFLPYDMDTWDSNELMDVDARRVSTLTMTGAISSRLPYHDRDAPDPEDLMYAYHEKLARGTVTQAPRPMQTTAPFPFLQLPRELRDQIYEDTLVRPKVIELWPEFGRPLHYRPVSVAEPGDMHPLALLQVNKQINMEAAEVLFNENDFPLLGRS
ncbi:hypothetical protein BDV95DRAFT_605471 [Massariosphaeria phaeospora]|uniref:Uncharacterized protein n=1 Tax=Massariosphaeria phaeospora TaxID=100035 RepID=A0A7C8MGR4_9PLEO|nr:hypothetical protein BDV95DRAFT_605471 [Massariosphaeria phaeospora]